MQVWDLQQIYLGYFTSLKSKEQEGKGEYLKFSVFFNLSFYQYFAVI